jgi:hypothetical protein
LLQWESKRVSARSGSVTWMSRASERGGSKGACRRHATGEDSRHLQILPKSRIYQFFTLQRDIKTTLLPEPVSPTKTGRSGLRIGHPPSLSGFWQPLIGPLDNLPDLPGDRKCKPIVRCKCPF